MAGERPQAAEAPCSSGGERFFTGTSGVRLEGEQADLADDHTTSASATKVGLAALLELCQA